ESLHAYVARHGIQTRSVTARALARFACLDPLRFAFCGKLVFQKRFSVTACSRLEILVPDFTEPTTLFACAVRRIEREQTRIKFFKRAATAWAAHLSARYGQPIFRIEQTRRAVPNFQRTPDNIACVHDSPPIDHAHGHFDSVLFEALQFPKMRDWDQSAIDIECVEPLTFRPARHVCMKAFARFHERRENL